MILDLTGRKITIILQSWEVLREFRSFLRKIQILMIFRVIDDLKTSAWYGDSMPGLISLASPRNTSEGKGGAEHEYSNCPSVAKELFLEQKPVK